MEFKFENEIISIPDYVPSKSNLYELDHWKYYKLTESKTVFEIVMINLDITGGCLEGLYEGFSDCYFCTAESVADIVEGCIDDTVVYNSVEGFINCILEAYEEYKTEFESKADFIKWWLNGDNEFRYYNGKIFRRVYC